MSASKRARFAAHRLASAPHAFDLPAEPTVATCDLDGSSCFVLSEEMLYPGSRFRMADELVEEHVSQLSEAHGRGPEVAIAWLGEQPTLMGLDFFRSSVELARQRRGNGSAATARALIQRRSWGTGSE